MIRSLQIQLRGQHSDRLIWFITLSLLSLLFLGTTLPFLAYYPPVGGDDIWILSASHKLAQEGVFGSDLFAGFFGADQHYLLNLPLHHFLQAALFKIVGSGIAQVRLISMLMGIALVWLVSWLALRWYGVFTAVLTAMLLVLWRSGLTGVSIPLLMVSRSARYDMGAVWWLWVCIAALFGYRQRPSSRRALFVGLSCGLAILTQFFGAFTLFIVAIIWWVWHNKKLCSYPATFGLIAGFSLAVTPYFIYIIIHFSDFIGQRTISSGRLDFLSWKFYVQNLFAAGRRFLHLLNGPGYDDAGFQSPAAWLVPLLIIPITWNLIHRYRRQKGAGDLLLLTSLLALVAGLWLFEQTKAPVYAIVLVPTICLGLALLLSDSWRWVNGSSLPRAWRQAVPIIIILMMLFVTAEGLGTYALSLIRAQEENQYALVGGRLAQLLPPDSSIIGFEQWWWPLREHPYRSWINLWSQWQWWQESQKDPRPLATLVAATGATHLIVTRIEPLYIQRYDPALQEQFSHLLTHCTRDFDHWQNPEYGEIVIYQLVRDTEDQLICMQPSSLDE